MNVAVGNRSFGKYGSAMHPGSLVMFVERPLGISGAPVSPGVTFP